MFFMLFMNPSYGIEGQFFYKISTQPLTIFVRALAMIVIASFIGFELWKTERIQKFVLVGPIFTLKPFFITLLISFFFFGVLIVVMWSLLHHVLLFYQPLSTPDSL